MAAPIAAPMAALQSASQAASYNAVLQVMFRLATFVLNAVIIRQTSREMLGVVNVRLTLLWSTILFAAREALRKACLGARVDGVGGNRSWAGVINLMWLSVPLGIVVAAALCYLWLFILQAPDDATYPLAVVVFALSAVLELLTEPLWLLAQSLLYVKLKVLAEGCALAVRCIVTIGLLLTHPHLGLAAFCAAQLAYAVTLVSIYYGYMLREARAGKLPVASARGLLPSGIGGKAWFISYPQDLFDLGVGFLQQSLLKQFLTEGGRYLMTFANAVSFADQGVYDIVTNLGALAVRFLFQPIEESFYTLFARLLDRQAAGGSGEVLGALAAQQRHADEALATRTLCTLLALVLRVGLTIAVFGQAYAFLLLDLYGGSVLSGGQGPLLLRAYAGYTLFLAVNGITECFAFAAMRPNQVRQHSRWMIAFSAIFVGASYLFTQVLGSVGFIMANMANMLARILKSGHTIVRFVDARPHTRVGGHPLWGALPAWPVWLAYAVAYGAISASEARFGATADNSFKSRLVHIAVGSSALLAVVGIVYTTERRLMADIHALWRPHGRTE